MINVLIGGDVCPIGRNLAFFKNGDAENILNDLMEEFERSELSIVNLECPLIKDSTPIMKNGPVLGVESDCVNGIKQAKIDIVNLANNHIMDHGPERLKDTIEVCTDAGIFTVGAGENLKKARKILIKKIDNVRIGILAVAEHEFSIATEKSWGANPLDLIDYVRNIRSQKGKFDYLIVLLHGGTEHYPLPSPRLKDTCHFMVEMGANAVIVQHTHCPGCYEMYEGAYIVYGQGNFIFDKGSKEKGLWNKGFLVRLEINNKNDHFMEIIPYVQSEENPGARKMNKENLDKFLEEIDVRSKKLLEPDFIKNEWLKLCSKRKKSVFHTLLTGFANNRIVRKVNRHFPFIEYLYTRKQLLHLQNVICCESHREIIETILEEEINNKYI